MICYENWHKEEDRSNYNELIVLPKAEISERRSFREKQETLICQNLVSEETGNSKVQTLSIGAIISKCFLWGVGGRCPLSSGGGL